LKKIIVTGGCGYIGSHTIVELLRNDYEVVSIDNLSRSEAKVLKGIANITGIEVQNIKADLANETEAKNAFDKIGGADGIIHFAAYKSVRESVKKPQLYFDNNINSLKNVLDCANKKGIKHFVFSSSCSVYGNTKVLPVREDTIFGKAESPYAATKQDGEKLVADFSKSHSLNSISLRYFNPVGAHPSIEIGESPIGVPEYLVPYITQTAIGKRVCLSIYGNDYNTPDGTCIRDYIHVVDIASAHRKALHYLLESSSSPIYEVFNLGTGNGISVLEAVKAFEKVSGKKLNYKIVDRRPGDVEAIYANNNKAREILHWQPKLTIEDMMLSAWKWEQKNVF